MKRFLLLLCICSATLNLWLAGNVSGRVAPSPLETSVATDGAAGAPFAPIGDTPDDDPSKVAALLAIEARAFDAVRRAARGYWQPGVDYELELGRAVLGAEERIRSGLIERFGPGAANDPLFRASFRPLDARYPFLSADQQLAVQRLRFERDLELRNASRGARPEVGADAGRGIDPAAAATASRHYREGLAAALDERALFELDLRDSSAARQLRASQVELSEQEFRAACAVLLDLERGAVGPAEVLAAREELRRLLGDRRFAELWAARDPAYSRIRAVTARHGLAESAVGAVYEVMSEFQDRRMQIAMLAEQNPDRAARESRAAADGERRALARLVGDDLAAEILGSRAIASYRLLGPGPGQD